MQQVNEQWGAYPITLTSFLQTKTVELPISLNQLFSICGIYCKNGDGNPIGEVNVSGSKLDIKINPPTQSFLGDLDLFLILLCQ